MNTVATIVGALVLIISTLVLAIVNNIRGSLDKLNGRLHDHLMDPGCHQAGIIQVREQIKAVDQTAKVAHKRIDALTPR